MKCGDADMPISSFGESTGMSISNRRKKSRLFPGGGFLPEELGKRLPIGRVKLAEEFQDEEIDDEQGCPEENGADHIVG
jgi:hypothetical protein